MNPDPFSFRVVANDVPREGRRYHIEADAEERRRLADALGIPEVAALEADLEVRPVGGQSLAVRGALKASVVQNCVVTLEPFSQEVAEAIDLTLMRAEAGPPGLRGGEVLIDAFEPDGPDLFHHGRIDLGIIVAEHLALGLDPYPRAPGIDFSGHLEDDSAADPSPFATLARLNKTNE
ncbi:MAG: DUF177 domain-containing protein [Rhizobiales bacterium]|nr:DUF177 domain-containing protein [Hyphomicrobiales bacterium]MDQ3559204.1 DUF177 domain-containing protein [Pseudomonadota bacterium]